VFHVSIGNSVLRPYAERSFFRGNDERQAPISRATEKYSAAGCLILEIGATTNGTDLDFCRPGSRFSFTVF